MKKTFSLFIVICSFSSFANPCEYSQLKFSKNKAKKAATAESHGLRFLLLAGEPELNVYEGPLKVYKKNKKLCSFDHGIFEDIAYFDQDKQYLMTKTYSGSCGEFTIYSLKTCKEVGKTAYYCGNANLIENKLMNKPPCESLNPDKNLYSCSTGKVFLLNSKSCTFELNEKESQAFTKKTIGLELPLNGQQEVTIKNKGDLL